MPTLTLTVPLDLSTVGRDLTHGAPCLHGRIGHQRQLDGGIGELVGEDRLVDVEHRVARSVLGDREDGLRRLHDLPRLGIAGRDDAGNAGPQHGVGKMVAGSAELGPCRVKRGLGRAVGFLGLIVLPLGREALGEQRLLAFVGGGRLAEHGLGGPDGGLGGGHRRLLLLRVESGQHLVGRHVVADIDQALDDPAATRKDRSLSTRARISPVRRTVGAYSVSVTVSTCTTVGGFSDRFVSCLQASQTQSDRDDRGCGGQPMSECK